MSENFANINEDNVVEQYQTPKGDYIIKVKNRRESDGAEWTQWKRGNKNDTRYIDSDVAEGVKNAIIENQPTSAAEPTDTPTARMQQRGQPLKVADQDTRNKAIQSKYYLIDDSRVNEKLDPNRVHAGDATRNTAATWYANEDLQKMIENDPRLQDATAAEKERARKAMAWQLAEELEGVRETGKDNPVLKKYDFY